MVVDEIKIVNPGDTKYKVGDVMPRGRCRQDQQNLGAKEAPAEIEPTDYLTAWEEDKYIIGQANIELDPKGHIVNDRELPGRGAIHAHHRDEIEYMDVSRRNSSSRSPLS